VAQFLRSNLTTIFGSKPRVSDLVDRKSTLVAVIPAKAEIQAVFDVEFKSNLDAGVR
jgi:hypothetical protein